MKVYSIYNESHDRPDVCNASGMWLPKNSVRPSSANIQGMQLWRMSRASSDDLNNTLLAVRVICV
jgi:hypothetical protein